MIFPPMADDSQEMTFWQHLDVLRGSIIRCIAAVMCCGVGAFCLKEQLFKVVFWPTETDFPLWKIWPMSEAESEIQLINTDLTQQFITHLEVAMIAGLLCVMPYILYELMRFIGPALYPEEKKAAFPAIAGGYVMFMAGTALSYLIIFPLTYRFLAGYQVSTDVRNMIALDSYVGTMLLLCTLMGIIFELPIVCGILARMGLLTAAPMKKYRRHAIVAILILAAVITPTGDAFTLTIVSLPIYLLYELSICIVGIKSRK